MKDENSIMAEDFEELLDESGFTVNGEERFQLLLDVTLSAEAEDGPVEAVDCTNHGHEEEPEVQEQQNLLIVDVQSEDTKYGIPLD